MGNAEERTVTITLDEYADLNAIAERVETLSRCLIVNRYANVGDICAILCIERPEED